MGAHRDGDMTQQVADRPPWQPTRTGSCSCNPVDLGPPPAAGTRRVRPASDWWTRVTVPQSRSQLPWRATPSKVSVAASDIGKRAGPAASGGERPMVGAAGFEPATSCSQSTCATVAPHPDGCERQYGTLLHRARAPGRQAGTGRGLTRASSGGRAADQHRGRNYPPTRNARPATTSTPSMITTKARSGSRSTMRLPSADPAIIRGPIATPMATDRAERIDAWP